MRFLLSFELIARPALVSAGDGHQDVSSRDRLEPKEDSAEIVVGATSGDVQAIGLFASDGEEI